MEWITTYLLHSYCCWSDAAITGCWLWAGARQSHGQEDPVFVPTTAWKMYEQNEFLFKNCLSESVLTTYILSNLGLMELHLTDKGPVDQIWCNLYYIIQCKSQACGRRRFGNTLLGPLLVELSASCLHRYVCFIQSILLFVFNC